MQLRTRSSIFLVVVFCLSSVTSVRAQAGKAELTGELPRSLGSAPARAIQFADRSIKTPT